MIGLNHVNIVKLLDGGENAIKRGGFGGGAWVGGGRGRDE